MEQQIKKTVKISLIFLAIGLLLGSLIVFAATPSATFYISGGVYPGAPSYTIWKEGSNYFAKDANGQIASGFSGTNISQIMQSTYSSGRSIFVKSGTYSFDATTTPCSNLLIEGEGHNTVLQTSANLSKGIFFMDSVSNVTIKNLRLDGVSLYSMGARTNISEFISFYGVEFTNFRSRGIYALETNHLKFQSCYFANVAQDASMSAIEVRGGTVYSTDIEVINCRFINATTVSGYNSADIFLLKIKGVLVSGCYFEGSANHGVMFRQNVNGSIISNNIFKDMDASQATDAVIQVSQYSINFVITNNLIYWTFNPSAAVSGILVGTAGGCAYGTISNNVIISEDFANTRVGIQSEGESGMGVDANYDLTVTGNVIHRTQYGIALVYTNTSLIDGNIVRVESANYGVGVASSNFTIVSNNQIIVPSGTGIDLTSGNSNCCVITGNSLNFTSTAIDPGTGANNIIEHNMGYP